MKIGDFSGFVSDLQRAAGALLVTLGAGFGVAELAGSVYGVSAAAVVLGAVLLAERRGSK